MALTSDRKPNAARENERTGIVSQAGFFLTFSVRTELANRREPGIRGFTYQPWSEILLRLVGVVRAAAELKVGRRRLTAHGVAAFGAASIRPLERALSTVSFPDFTLDGCRNVSRSRCGFTRRAQSPAGRDLLLLEIRDE
jgi:hypothetical protein